MIGDNAARWPRRYGQVSQVAGCDEQPRPVSHAGFVQVTLKQLETTGVHFTSHAHD
jgi:hypothetical protein